MDHEQTLKQLASGVEVNAVSLVYLVVVLHEVGRRVEVSYVGCYIAVVITLYPWTTALVVGFLVHLSVHCHKNIK